MWLKVFHNVQVIAVIFDVYTSAAVAVSPAERPAAEKLQLVDEDELWKFGEFKHKKNLLDAVKLDTAAHFLKSKTGMNFGKLDDESIVSLGKRNPFTFTR